MNDLLLELQPHLIAIFGALLSYLGYKMNKLINNKIAKDKQEAIIDVVKGVVAFVEQVAKVDVELVGIEKFNLAKERALEILNEKGLEITNAELEMLIESFVLGLGGDKVE